MREIWNIISYGIAGMYCRLVGHRWWGIGDDEGNPPDERICERCLLRERHPDAEA